MKITFIRHNCYVAEDEYTQIIFNYTDGVLPTKDDKGRIFVVTDAHPDFFSTRIFQSDGDLYLLSHDIHTPFHLPVLHLSPFDEITLQNLHIRASGSTDHGISIQLNLGNKTLLYAGNLNLWHWPEDKPSDRKIMEEDFDRYLNFFESINPTALFFSVDYRLEEEYLHGPMAAVKRLNPKHFFPIQFADHPQILPIFQEKMKDHSTTVHLLVSGESIHL